MPPLQAHTDVIVYEEDASAHVEENVNSAKDFHHDEHHDDNEDDKNKEHHHHCYVVMLTNIFINSDLDYHFKEAFLAKDPILSYKNLHGSNVLDRLFQPPRI